KSILKPPDQLHLTEQELKEEFTKILTAENPRASKNVVRYSFKDKSFMTVPTTDHLAVHFSIDGNKIHEKSEEAKKQLKRGSLCFSVFQATPSQTVEQDMKVLQDDEENLKGDAALDADGDNSATKSRGDKKLTNQFNFSERATQPYNNPPRDKQTMTEPPPAMTYSANVTQWEIYDAYQKDYDKQVKNKDKKIVTKTQELKKKKTSSSVGSIFKNNFTKSLKSLKIIERMVTQNIHDEITYDYKYYEDASDEFKEQKGSLLPLWTFKFKKVKNLSVTCICWNHIFPDLFAASYGSYEYENQVEGEILLFTLKNPSYPEYIYQMHCSVNSVDFHPNYPYLLVAGLYDGNVAVFDVVTDCHEPVFLSNYKTGKHLDVVNQVKWQSHENENGLNFFSISNSGEVFNWTILKKLCTLKMESSDNLKLNGSTIPLELSGCGITFDFHPKIEDLYLVGTEEGKVHVCSKNQSNRFLSTYDAHFGPVYKVLWSPYCPSLFITCSDDWLIKIWDRSIESEPLFVFDLGCAVEDVEWAPYSSTVFAAVTQDGKAYVYDLNVEKHESLCEQRIAQKRNSTLTRVAFNQKHPIILVGDDRGTIQSFKLSPNIRKLPKDKKGQDQLKPEEKEALRRTAEVDKLEKLLVTVRPFVRVKT
ncbi:hypothetical protein HELRODRAFT_71864, partial [Helobdella robusta]|uniref:Uncharacterized protein n=1 Tax=Helobdella robusta TaxID=6412 RepID=T1G0S5_HELRO